MWHVMISVFCNLLLFKAITAGKVGDVCVPSTKISKGTCKLALNCIDVLRSIRTTGTHQLNRCGFINRTEVVCCPNEHYPVATTTTTATTITATAATIATAATTTKTITVVTETTTEIPTQKYGDIGTLRIADRECQKIINTSLPPLNNHIIGGTIVSPGEFPHMVALGYIPSLTKQKDFYEFKCGGSLVSTDYIITAAHCITRERPLMARVGVVEVADGLWNNETDVRLQELIKHPDNRSPMRYDDLALLKLEHPVSYSVTLNPICLYTSDKDPEVPLAITGWGRSSTKTHERSPTLLKATVSVVPTSKCAVVYPAVRTLPQGIVDSHICAGDPEGTHDSCQGDSGGPLQGLTASDGHYRLVGVTSFGRGCGQPDTPGVYTRVSRYLDWIESIVWPEA